MMFFKKKKEIELEVNKVYCMACGELAPTFENRPSHFFRLCGECWKKQYDRPTHAHAMFDHLARRLYFIEMILREQEISDGFPAHDCQNPFKDPKEPIDGR